MATSETAVILVLIGGPALFLGGAILFKQAVFKYWSVPRLAGLVATLALYPLSRRALAAAAVRCHHHHHGGARCVGGGRYRAASRTLRHSGEEEPTVRIDE